MNKLIDFAFNTGLIRLGRSLWSKSLTVINYHRIDDPHRADFDSFRPNVSATPEDFDRQMDYLSRWFNVVSVRDIVQWLEGRYTLPPHAALITFDDGYLDNYTSAFPILRKYNLPAVVFLTTGHIDTDRPFFWDLAAYCFIHTERKSIRFPDGSNVSWNDLHQRELALRACINSLKFLPETEKEEWVRRLPHELDVTIPLNSFRSLMMNWNQIREMKEEQIEFGAHTKTHPILTRVSLERAQTEIEDSKALIEKEIGAPILCFAYPNGTADDFSPAIEELVANAGFKVAFSLLEGPASLREVRRNPYTVRRIVISQNITLPRFAAAISGTNRYRDFIYGIQ